MSAKTGLLEDVVGLVGDRMPEWEARGFEAFVRQYYDWVAAEELEGRDPLDVYGAALSHWEFAGKREAGIEKIRVYTPDFERHGWESSKTVVEVVNDDMPFLVDSVSMELNRHGFNIHLVVHPVLRVRRDEEDRLLEVLSPDEQAVGAEDESFIHVEVDRQTEPGRLEELHDCLHRVLREVRSAVEDWGDMREKMRAAVDDLGAALGDVEGLDEVRSFLRWLEDDNFTFLGYREYERASEDEGPGLRVVRASGLGILREDEAWPAGCGTLDTAVEDGPTTDGPLVLTKSGSRATVHRPSHMDFLAVKRYDEDGEVVGERHFLGLYTSAAYRSRPWEIPLIRRKARRVMERAGFPAASYNRKALVDILETYPRDELFRVPEGDLYETAIGILNLQERLRVRLFVRWDAPGRFFSCLVYLPRDRYDTGTRERIRGILLDALGGDTVEYDARLSESVLARLHFVVYPEAGEALDYDVEEIQARIAEATRSWADDLRDALVERFGEERGAELHRRYGAAFPASYREDFPVRTAAADVGRLEELDPEGEILANLYRPPGALRERLRFKLFRTGDPIPLSRVVPILEHLGVTVADERPHEVRRVEGTPAWVYDFGLDAGDVGRRLEEIKDLFEESFLRAWASEVEDDDFNRLVSKAGLSWRRVSVLRAYARYLRQTNIPFSQDYMEDAFHANPHVARSLVELFEARFDPEGPERAGDEADRLTAEIEEALDAVESLDEDRIMRSFLAAILATVRTNYFQSTPEDEPKPYLSFKLDSRKIPSLPLPRPMFEIFVYSPRMEGVHLRGGRVARGGIRWSDRREDFRTEVLGLMKAQMVKNAVIVPVGAKGGFVVKRAPAEREALPAEAVECYRILVCGMLDLTDNLDAEGNVFPPPEVVRYEGDDPYLVVAADKGTATFSDVANEISVQEYGFWLGDAFASGGATGYDHKQMGITARGAWESVKRHLRELGTDAQDEDFTVLGIGDMSGDVFGNAMLLSRHIKLVGAFDHRHIFLDPEPDPEASFRERGRLFKLPHSSWADYDEKLISEGGGIFPRTAKSVSLSAQIKALLGVEADALPPNDLISALLKAPVDLLFNGGIGTYVKASGETNAEVGDKANDALRVDGGELRCRVVGEGGNLGFTQKGRIEYALSGGRINTDAVDNSAGVDASDHEVNIKVLLDTVVESGNMTNKQRNELLAGMTGEVAELVLADNREQNRALANATAQAASMVDMHGRYIDALERSGRLDRALELLPDKETLDQRKAAGLGLTSPELSVLLSYAKMELYDALLDSDAPEDPYLFRELQRYFPAALGEQFGERIRGHRLGREIVATRLANEVVNRAGTTFVFRLVEETGARAPDVVRAYVAAREIFGVDALWAKIETLDRRLPPETQTLLFLNTRRAVERATRWLLRNRRPPIDVPTVVSYFSPRTAALPERFDELMPPARREALQGEITGLTGGGVPEDLAWRVARLAHIVETILD